MKYKLGSQLVVDPVTQEENFDYNLCAMSNNGAFVIESIWLGIRSNTDPVIYKAHELVKLLNEEKV